MQSREHIVTGWATKVSDRFGRAIMASESASPDDYMDMDATDLPPWPSSRSDVPAGSAKETVGSTDVDHSTAALLVQDTPQHGVTASTVRALNDDDPPIPLLHVIDHEKATEGHQLHDGPPGPPCISHGFDDSRRKNLDNDAERQMPDSAQDSTPTVDSTMGASMTKASVAAGQCMAKDVEEGNVSSGGTAPPMSSRMGEVAATAAVERDAQPAWCSTPKPQTVLPFYQRKSFVSDMTCTLFVIGLAVAMGMLLLSNVQEPTTTNVSSSNQMKTPTLAPTPSNIPTNLPTRPLVGTSQKLLAPDGAVEVFFQRSAAIYENTIVVGAYNGYNSGSAHVFVRSGEKWTHQAKLLATDRAAGDRFGDSTAMYKNTIVVGAPLDDDNGGGAGSAHVFVRSGKEWKHEAKLLALDGAALDMFGNSVAIYEDTIVVGAYGDEDNGLCTGSAHVFVRSGEDWRHQAKLLAPNRARGDLFGESIAINGDTLVVGAPEDHLNGSYSGSTYIFVRSGEEWTLQAKLLTPNGAAYDYFGESVALYEDTIVVGASIDSNDNRWQSGSAHVYVRSGEEWTHQAKLLAPDGAPGDYFGDSVAIYKDTIVVSSPFDDDDKESAHVFVRSGDEWIHQTKLLAPDKAAQDWFGDSISIYESKPSSHPSSSVLSSSLQYGQDLAPPQIHARAHFVKDVSKQQEHRGVARNAQPQGKSPTEPPHQAEIPRAQADGERPDARLDPRPGMMNSAPPLPLHRLCPQGANR
ncbi:hypothetical protein THAOC_02059, partial [Thalassiosira oceanica]